MKKNILLKVDDEDQNLLDKSDCKVKFLLHVFLHVIPLSEWSNPAPINVKGEHNGSWPGCLRQGFDIL